MEISIDDLTPFLQLPDALQPFLDIIDEISADLVILDDRIIKLIETISGIKQIEVNMAMPAHAENAQHEPLTSTEHAAPQEKKEEKSNLWESVKEPVKVISNTGKIIKNGLEILEPLAEGIPALEKVKKGMGAFNGAMEVIGGFGEMAEATTITEGLVAGTGMLAGLGEIAAVLTGPVGWAIGGAAILGGYLLTRNDGKKQEDNGKQQVETKPYNSLDDGFAEIERQDDLQKLVAVKRPITQLDWKAIYEELDSPYLVKDREIRIEKHRRETAINPGLLDNKYTKQMEDNESAIELAEQVGIPIRTEPESQIAHLRKEITDVKTKYQYASFLFSYPFDLTSMNKEIDTITKKYGPSLLPFLNYTENERRREVGLPIADNNVKDNPIKYERNANQGNSLASKMTNINLNKSMIENFTVNVKDAKQGTSELRHMVEEVLLEVLENANLID